MGSTVRPTRARWRCGLSVSATLPQDHIEELCASGLPLPDVNQLELRPCCQKPDLTSYLAKEDISVMEYSNLVPLAKWLTETGHDSAKSDEMK